MILKLVQKLIHRNIGMIILILQIFCFDFAEFINAHRRFFLIFYKDITLLIPVHSHEIEVSKPTPISNLLEEKNGPKDSGLQHSMLQ